MGNSLDLKFRGIPLQSDIHDNKTRLVFRILSWSIIFHVIGIGLLARVLLWGLTYSHCYNKALTEDYWTRGVICVLPFLILDTILMLMFLSPLGKGFCSRPQSRYFRKLFLCLVTRGTNVQTVNRGIYRMRDLHKVDNRVQLVILHDGDCPNFDHLRYFGVDIIRIPGDFQPRTAKYKARALEFFRRHVNCGDDDWILHLDEETILDDHCVVACIDFIEREVKHDYAQGLICYNDANYWKNWLLSYSEIVRFREDLGRYQFAHRFLHFPLNGYHGSFCLTRGTVENAVTWETDCLAEDFWFALEAWRKGFSGGFIYSMVREQNNHTFRDYFLQRRRWHCGIWSLGWLGKTNIFVYTLGNLSAIPTFLVSVGLIRLPFWALAWATVCVAYHWYSAAFAGFIQDVDADVPVIFMALHILAMPAMTTLVSLLDFSARIFSFLRPVRPEQGFHIVHKE